MTILSTFLTTSRSYAYILCMNSKESFAYYFKKYRLKSEFETLSDFADALAENGIVYETSIFSHWQKGTRIPKDRFLLLKMINIFISRGGIRSDTEANLLLESAGQGYLTEGEKKQFEDINASAPFLIPPMLPTFIDRKMEIRKIVAALKNKKRVLMIGSTGTGKTSLAIAIAHALRQEYPDGVLWAQTSSTNTMSILANFALAYKENIFFMRDIDSRSEFVRTLLSTKKALLILDNISSNKEISKLLPISPSLSVILTSQSRHLQVPNSCIVDIKSFDERKASLLFIKILGISFFTKYKKELLDLANLVGYLPLALSLLAKKVQQLENMDFKEISLAIKTDTLRYLRYQDQNIQDIFELSFQSLKNQEKELFISLSILKGPDFSIEIVYCMHQQLTKMQTAEILEELVEKSFLQRSREKRYALHPALRIFAESKNPPRSYYNKILEFFLEQFEKTQREKMPQLSRIEPEVETIIHVFKKSYDYGNWKLIIKLWEYITIILWDLGRWDELVELSSLVIDICNKTNQLEAKAQCYLRDLSLVYFQRNENKQAKLILREGLSIARSLHNDNLTAYGFLRLGMISLQEKKCKEAINYLRKSLQIFQKLDEHARIGECLCYLSNAYLKTKRNGLAKKTVRKALEICTLIDHKRCQADSLSYLAEIYISEHNYQEAKKLLLKSLQVDDEIVRRGQIWIYNTAALSQIEDLTGFPKKAEKYHKEFIKNNKFVKLSWRLRDLRLK